VLAFLKHHQSPQCDWKPILLQAKIRGLRPGARISLKPKNFQTPNFELILFDLCMFRPYLCIDYVSASSTNHTLIFAYALIVGDYLFWQAANRCSLWSCCYISWINSSSNNYWLKKLVQHEEVMWHFSSCTLMSVSSFDERLFISK
jgi:hypothetical protein